NFLGILGYSLVIPVLVFIVADFGGNGFMYGVIGASYPFFQFWGAPRLGKLSDKVGRKKVLILTQLGSFFAWSLFILAFFLPKLVLFKHHSAYLGDLTISLPLVFLFLARTLDGYTGGNISVANAYLSDISTNEDRNKNFGLLGASTSMGFVVGPTIAGLFTATYWGLQFPLYLAAIVAFASIWIIYYRLPESMPCVVDTEGSALKSMRRIFQVEHRNCYQEGETNNSKTNLKQVLKVSGIRSMYLIYFLNFLAFSLFYVALPVYVSQNLSWSPFELGIFLAYFSLAMIIAQGPLLSKLSKKINALTLLLGGSILLAWGFYFLKTDHILILYIAVTLMALGNGVMWPSFLSMLSAMGDSASQGTIQGFGASMGSLASVFGLLLGGLLVESIGNAVFIIGTFLFGLIFSLSIRIKWKHQHLLNSF
ncbi:MAG: MFS transporter, partial [Bacteroidota bacterium]